MTPVRIEVVSSADALAAIGPAWDRLVGQAGITHPFLTHDWILSWWESFGAGRKLHVLLVWEGDELIGIAPLMISRARMYGFPVREIGFIYNDHTPRFDFIIFRNRAAVFEAIRCHLSDAKGRWSVIRLCQLTSDSASLGEVTRLLEESDYLVGTWPSTASPYLAVRGSFEDHSKSLPRGVRANLKRRMKRLEEQGVVEFESLNDGEQLDSALEEAFQMEAESWKGAAGTAMSCRREIRRFYSALAHRALRSGTLYLTYLRLNGRRIAFDFSLIFQDRLFKLKPGYAMEYHACSPGAQLTAMTVRDAFERNLIEVDFLGDADPWKLDWTTSVRQNSWLYAFQPSFLGHLLYFAKFRFLPWLRRTRLSKVAEAA